MNIVTAKKEKNYGNGDTLPLRLNQNQFIMRHRIIEAIRVHSANMIV